MDDFNSVGHQPADTAIPHTPGVHYMPSDHQLTDHGTPDPVPQTPSPFSQPHFTPYQQPEPTYEQPAPAAFIPEPPKQEAALSTPADDRPVPVVKVLSVRGVEYAMMSFALWIGAASLIWILDTLILGGASFQILAFPLSVLLVSLPIFAFLYLRLRRAELNDPSLRLEPSKRRFSQITQLVTFLTCLFNVIAVVYIIMGIVGGEDSGSIGKTLGAAAVTLVVAGGILVYYWFDEHKLVKR